MNAQEQVDVNGYANSSLSLSLLNLFEIVLAYSIVFSVDRFMHLVLGFYVGPVILLGCMYPFKILLAFAARKRRVLSLIGYTCVAGVSLVWPIYVEWSNMQITWIGFIICIPMIFLTIPTTTFFIDMMATKQRSPRFLIWRSVVEIVIIFPPWMYVSAFIGLFIGGWWI